MKLLIDASSMLEVLKNFEEEKSLRILSENFVLDLTKYEVGNALWKEYILHHAIGEDEFQELIALLQNLITHTKVLVVDAENLKDVAEIAAKEKITFYDASYIAMAKRQDLTLTTEDEQLRKAASKHARTATSRSLQSV